MNDAIQMENPLERGNKKVLNEILIFEQVLTWRGDPGNILEGPMKNKMKAENSQI